MTVIERIAFSLVAFSPPTTYPFFATTRRRFPFSAPAALGSPSNVLPDWVRKRGTWMSVENIVSSVVFPLAYGACAPTFPRKFPYIMSTRRVLVADPIADRGIELLQEAEGIEVDVRTDIGATADRAEQEKML